MIKKLLLYLLLGMNSLMAFSQTDNYGTEFWTGFMTNWSATSELKLFLAARQYSKVTISIPLLSYSRNVTIQKDSLIVVTIPNSVGQINSSEVVEKTGIHIVSDYPIAITSMNLMPATTDATVVFPLKNIPNNPVYVTGHPRTSFMNEFLLVSPENGVEVEIFTTRNTAKHSAFTPYKITLDQGETYQVQCNKTMDGSSIRVLNNKRLIVYTGDKCSNFPCGACDHQVEQVFPNQLLDTSYYVLPHFGHTKGYKVKVVSIDTTLWVKVNKKMYRVGTRDSALEIDVPSGDSVLHISGPRKFSCFQFMKGASCNGYITGGWGDPSILQLLSAKYMGSNSTFNCVNSTNLRDHFVSILINTASKNDTYLDGSKIASSEFIPVSDNPNFSYAKLKIGLGIHTIYCKLGHLAYCYGIGGYESYLYTAGFSLPNFEIDIKDTTLSFDCKNNKVNMRFDAKLEGAIKTYRWDFGDGTYDTVKTVKHSYPVGKEFTIKLWAKGYNNKEDSVIKKFTFNWPEFNPVFDKLLCDPKFIYEEKNPFFANFKWHDASTKNSYMATKNEKIWVSATDTSGYCKFTDTAQVYKIEVLSKVKVDTISNCHLNNLFKFSDSSYVKNDQIKYKVWNFPGGVNLYDTTNFYYHFRQPGNYMVYLDIYPENALCKSRLEIPVKINWNTDIDAKVDKDKYCHGDTAEILDLSYSCCQKVKKYYWEIEGSAKQTSSTGQLKAKVYYDYKNKNGINNFNYITETEQGCRDTIKSSIIVWPSAKSNFDLGIDTIKCLTLSRWNFTHVVDESASGPYSMIWDFGNGKTGTQSQYKNVRYNDTGLYRITFKTTTAIGCVDSTSKFVRAISNAKALFRVKDSIQCQSSNGFEFINNSVGHDLKYDWNFGNAKTSNLSNPGKQSYSSAGIYTVKLKVLSNYAGCFADSTTQFVSVLKNPMANFSYIQNSVCLKNNSLSLKDSSQFFNGKYKLYWHIDNGIDSSFNPKSISFKDTGSYDLLLIVIDSANCEDSIMKTIRLKPDPSLKLTIDDTVQCFGINNFKIQSQNKESVKTRTWRLNNAIISGNESLINLVNLSPEGLYKLSLSEETEFGCKDSLQRYIEVLPKPMVEFDIDNDSQCLDNNSFNFKNKSISKDVVLITQYFKSNVLIGKTADLLNQNFTISGLHNIKFRLETENACKDSVTKTIYLSPKPIATFLDDSACLGDEVHLKSMQTSGNDLAVWTWNMNDGSRYEPGLKDNITYVYKNSGTYNPILGVKDKLGCYGSYTGKVHIYPLPLANFSFKVLNSDNDNTSVKLLPTVMGYRSYLWSLPDGKTISGDTPTVKVSKFFRDRIGLRVESEFGCFDTASQFLYIFPSLTNIYYENAFTPNGDILNDQFKPYRIEGAENYVLRIYNRWGEQLFISNQVNEGWDGYYHSELVPSGVYIFTVEFKYADGKRYSTRGNVTVIR